MHLTSWKLKIPPSQLIYMHFKRFYNIPLYRYLPYCSMISEWWTCPLFSGFWLKRVLWIYRGQHPGGFCFYMKITFLIPGPFFLSFPPSSQHSCFRFLTAILFFHLWDALLPGLQWCNLFALGRHPPVEEGSALPPLAAFVGLLFRSHGAVAMEGAGGHRPLCPSLCGFFNCTASFLYEINRKRRWITANRYSSSDTSGLCSYLLWYSSYCRGV